MDGLIAINFGGISTDTGLSFLPLEGTPVDLDGGEKSFGDPEHVNNGSGLGDFAFAQSS
jgi:hypothetical protein